MQVNLIWATPKADELLGYMARVSNTAATPDDPVDKLIKYLIDHKHWSPFEMANVCVEVWTTRDIARQILRHKSLFFQEFSQRYAIAPEAPEFAEARLQDTKNRQNSIVTDDMFISKEWARLQDMVWGVCYGAYKAALALGIAKELARKLLPEGLTRSRMYINGTVRSWLHYLSVRTGVETQLEHRQVARAIEQILLAAVPSTMAAAYNANLIEVAK
jgi:thymidylate synthase (FAD)